MKDYVKPAQRLAPTPHPKYPSNGGLLNPAFKYTPADRTDVRVTWRKHGWNGQIKK